MSSHVAGSAADVLTGVPVGDISLAGLVALFVMLVFFGKLIPKSGADQTRADLLEQVHAERQAKEEAAKLVIKLTEINGEQAATIRDLVPAARVGVRVGEEVQRYAVGGDNVPTTS